MSVPPFSSTINIKSARPVLKSPNKQLRMTVGSKVLHKPAILWCLYFLGNAGQSETGFCHCSWGTVQFSRQQEPQSSAPGLGISRCVYFIYRGLLGTPTFFNSLHLRSKSYLPVSSQNLTNIKKTKILLFTGNVSLAELFCLVFSSSGILCLCLW